MRFLTPPKDPTTARVNLGTWETDGTAQVMTYKYMKDVLVNVGSILPNSSFIHESVSKVGSKPL